MERARAAGAVLERPIVSRKWGRMANMADPFGHGFCLLQFRGGDTTRSWADHDAGVRVFQVNQFLG